MITTGALLMSLVKPSTSFLVYLGMPLLASGGVGLLVTNMQIG